MEAQTKSLLDQSKARTKKAEELLNNILVALQEELEEPQTPIQEERIKLSFQDRLKAFNDLHKDYLTQAKKVARASQCFSYGDGKNAVWTKKLSSKDIHAAVALHFLREGNFDKYELLVEEHLPQIPDWLGAAAAEYRTIHSLAADILVGNFVQVKKWLSPYVKQRIGSAVDSMNEILTVEYLGYLRRGEIGYALEFLQSHLSHLDISRPLALLLLREDPSAPPPSMPPFDILPLVYGEGGLEKIAEKFKERAAQWRGETEHSPLELSCRVGHHALPTLAQMQDAHRKRGDAASWLDIKQLVGEVGINMQDPSPHSVFVCPVSKEVSVPAEGDENPSRPVLLPCGHIVSHSSALSLIKPGRTSFPCMYCSEPCSLNRQVDITFVDSVTMDSMEGVKGGGDEESSVSCG